MRQALHIFKKDVRYLRFEIALVLALAAIFTAMGARSSLWFDEPHPDQSIPGGWIAYLLPLSWGFLIARVMHAEPVPGDRQFWFTRPYAWRSLLAAKALFILTFVILPMLIADPIVISAYGFSPAAELRGLLWNQFLITAAFTLPLMAICSMTSGFAQLFGAVFVIALAVFAWTLSFSNSVLWMNWITIYYVVCMLLGAGFLIVTWQYAFRKTAAARSLAISAIFAIVLGIALFPRSAAYGIQLGLSKIKVDPSSIRVEMNRREARAHVEADGRLRISIPIDIVDVAEGLTPRMDWFDATIEGKSGSVRRVQWASIKVLGERTMFQTILDAPFHNEIKNQPVTLRGRVFITLFGNRRAHRLSFEHRFVRVPGFGSCIAGRVEFQNPYVRCFSAFRTPKVELALHFLDVNDEEQRGQFSRPLMNYDPFPADPSVNPVNQYSFYSYSNPIHPKALVAATLVTAEPLAHVSRDFELTNLRLSDIVASPGN